MDQNLRTLLEGEPVEVCNNATIKPGVICSTIIPQIPNIFPIIEPLSCDTSSPNSRKYSILSMDYRPLVSYLTNPDKPPHFELGVRSDEAVVAYKVKIRTVLVLTHKLSEEDRGFPSHFKNCILCAPLYTLVEKDGRIKPSYNPLAVQNIVALKYRRVFPLPGYSLLNSQISALRLDQVQPVRVKYLSKPIAKVGDKWLGFIREWIHFYGTGKLRNKYLRDAREYLLDLMKENSSQ